MATKGNWKDLSHEEKIKLLKNLNDGEIIDSYFLPDKTDDEFKRHLSTEREFWNPDNIQEIEIVNKPPTKETTIGSWRDLNRAEAFLELIDNSIDAWMRRRKKHPNETAPTLKIYIDLEEAVNALYLTYEDNAGGVDKDKLINLVIPGYSETTNLEHTIGSYRTGGKKAIFKLASEANIRTRFWSPMETSYDAFEIHLDEKWLQDPALLHFPTVVSKIRTFFVKGKLFIGFG